MPKNKQSQLTQTYKTIRSRSESLFKEKGSKFIGIAIPVKTEEEIKLRQEELRKEFHDARHHCYAWMLGFDRNQYRANDDGEPSNSAGKPILGQIESFGLTNVLIVVIRYFGGTKLGVGGLISAYKTSAKEALEAADLYEDTVKASLEFSFDYTDMPMVMNFVKENEFQIIKQAFESDCILRILVEQDQSDFVKNKLKEFSSYKLIQEQIV